MQIIWNKEVAEQMQHSHTVLELETFELNESTITAYCVIPPEKIIGDLPQLDDLIALHNKFLQEFKKHNLVECTAIAQELTGRFGGELDTFYEEILKKLKTTT